MKLTVQPRENIKQTLLYPADDITMAFLQVFNKGRPAKAFTRQQILELRALGMEIEVLDTVLYWDEK